MRKCNKFHCFLKQFIASLAVVTLSVKAFYMHNRNSILHILIIIVGLSLSSPTFAAANLQAYDIYGKLHSLPTQPGKWVIINYWAAWCHYCIREIPEFNKVAEAIQKHSAILFAINYDDISDQEQQQFAENHAMNFLLLRRNPFDNLVSRDTITTLPTTFIISPSGQVKQLNGEQNFNTIMNAIQESST